MTMLVLDFDGTMTDAEAEGGPYRLGYLQDLALLVDRPADEVLALAERLEGQVLANPEQHGWLFGGSIVAPASVDPYLRVMPVARMLLDHFGVLEVPHERERVLDRILYKYNYKKTLNVFREGAGAFLRGLEGQAVYVVTNSHTDAVQEKLADLGADWLVPRVHGLAKKYVLEPGFSEVPESMSLPGLGRPVLLRRGHYHRALSQLLADEGKAWSELLVVGDIFELDLCLPLQLGARVGLMVNEFTPAYEVDFLRGHARGYVLGGIPEIAGLL